MARSLFSRLGYLFASSAFRVLKDKMDPRAVNGGVFLGLDGIVIKSHGGADPVGFCGAIEIAYQMAQHDLRARIRESISQSQDGRLAAAAAAASP